MPVSYPYIQYGGIWTTSQATDAVAAGTWPTPPAPHLYSWGRNDIGQLGLGNTTNYSSPKQIGSLTNWSFISGARPIGNFILAIKNDGTLWTWGANGTGQLGLGNTTNYSSPKQVGSLTNWLIGSAGEVHSAAIKTDGTLWVWGNNGFGQLGLGNTTNYSSPKQVGALADWSNVSCGRYYTVAIKTNGTLWSWGANNYGKLGLGNTTYQSSPTQVGALTNWAAVCAGGIHTLAVKTDGTLWSWGNASFSGMLGLGNQTNYSSPKQVGALTDWLKVASGYSDSVAIKTTGTLWSWGKNSNGQLGLGNTTNYSSPKQVGLLTNWLEACGSYNFYTSTKTDGTLWSWGINNYGQLGINTSSVGTYKSSPVQVGSLTSWTKTTQSGYSVSAIAVT